jgi:hypothetical protein
MERGDLAVADLPAIDTLMSFSEFALALAGFAAIALVLGRREGMLSSGSAYVVQFMVVNALGPALLAMLAVVLFELGLAEATVVRICCGIYVSIAAFFVVLSIRRERHLASAGELLFPPLLTRAIWGGSSIAHLILLATLIGFPFGPSVGLFLLGLWVLLGIAATQFVALLFLAFR